MCCVCYKLVQSTAPLNCWYLRENNFSSPEREIIAVFELLIEHSERNLDAIFVIDASISLF